MAVNSCTANWGYIEEAGKPINRLLSATPSQSSSRSRVRAPSRTPIKDAGLLGGGAIDWMEGVRVGRSTSRRLGVHRTKLGELKRQQAAATTSYQQRSYWRKKGMEKGKKESSTGWNFSLQGQTGSWFDRPSGENQKARRHTCLGT